MTIRIFLLASILFGLGFRMVAVSGRQTVTHDEGISYLAATGHQAEYSEMSLRGTYPAGHWVRLSEWKRFIEPDRFFCFRKIGMDLARYDYHPPLYFWCLHIWVSLFGVGIWAGPALNFLLTLVIAALLLKLADEVLQNRFEASAVVCVWILSPYAMFTSTEARQYELFTLLSLVLIWRTIRYVEGRNQTSVGELAVLSLITLAGALTYYYFALVVAGCGVFVLFNLLKANVGKCLRFFTPAAIGYAVFLLLHPAISQMIRARQEKEQPLVIEDVVARATTAAATVSQFFVHQKAGDGVLILLTVVLLMGAAFIVSRGPSKTNGDRIAIPRMANYVMYFLLWNLCSVSFLYVVGISPSYAMGAKYLAVVWLFVGFVPVLIFRLAPTRLRSALLVILCGWQFLYGLAFAAVTLHRARTGPEASAVLNRADAVLSDSVARGIFPRIFFVMEGDKLIFAARQGDLIRGEDKWIPGLPRNSVYVGNLDYGNTLEEQTVIVSTIKRIYDVSPVKSGMYRYNFFLISP